MSLDPRTHLGVQEWLQGYYWGLVSWCTCGERLRQKERVNLRDRRASSRVKAKREAPGAGMVLKLIDPVEWGVQPYMQGASERPEEVSPKMR